MIERALYLARLSTTAGMLGELTSDVTVEHGGLAPAPGEWSIVEVARHLVAGDRDKLLPRLRRMLVETRPVFDTAAAATGDASDLPTLVAAFASAREQVVRILAGLEAAGWLREGVSPSRGVLTVDGYARSTDRHDTEHLRQIQDVRARLGLRPSRCEARAPRLRRIASEEQPAFPAFSPEAWARERDHGLDAFDASLAAFEDARAETIAFLRALPAEAGERLGVSGFFGPMTLRQYATHVADHDIEHLAQLARARAAALTAG